MEHSVKYPSGILEDIPIKVVNFCILVEFIILDITEDTRTQFILRRPFMAIVGCKIDVKKGMVTFDWGRNTMLNSVCLRIISLLILYLLVVVVMCLFLMIL